MPYFNALNRDMFEKEFVEIQNQILVLNEFYESKLESGDISAFDAFENGVKTSIKPIIVPKQVLVNEFYTFLLKQYKDSINGLFFQISVDFKKEIYGMLYNDQRAVGLKHFNRIYEEFKPEGLDMFKPRVSINGIERVDEEKRMEFLYLNREARKRAVSLRQFVLEFLYGNLTFFDRELMNNDDLINDFIFKESHLKILLSLNDEFGFEKDEWFTEINKIKEMHPRYLGLTKNYELFEFIYFKVKSFNKDKKANANALYLALKTLPSINHKPKIYLEFMLEAFNLQMSKISYPPEHENRNHHQKVKVFTEELSKLEGTF